MSIEVMIDKERIVVPSGTVKYVIDELLTGGMDIGAVRQYVAEQKLDERCPYDLGYVDFDHLTDGKPTIVGDFYQKNTTFGLKLSGKWKEILKKQINK